MRVILYCLKHCMCTLGLFLQLWTAEDGGGRGDEGDDETEEK